MKGRRDKGVRWYESPYGRMHLQTINHRDVCVVTWVNDAVAARRLDADERAALPERRQQILADILAVPLHRNRRPRVDGLERTGERVLNRAAEERAKRPWIVRVYYECIGGDQVYAEFGGLTEAEALEMRNAFPRATADAWAVKRPRDTKCTGLADGAPLACSYPKAVGVCAAETWCPCRGSGMVETPAPSPRPGHRKVVWPSEHQAYEASVDDYYRACSECNSDELCRPECSVAPWNREPCAEDSQSDHTATLSSDGPLAE